MRRLLSCVLLCTGFWLALGGRQVIWAERVIGDNSSLSREKEHPDNGSYHIGRGDVLEINVWREPMLSGETFVRSDGMVSLPLLGDVQASGLTPMELKDIVQERLKEYVDSPVVTVLLKNPVSQKFYVVGEVKTPGEYDLAKELTFLQAIALAGGFTEWANTSDILLFRSENGRERRIRLNYKDIVKGKEGIQNLQLQANDTLVVR